MLVLYFLVPSLVIPLQLADLEQALNAATGRRLGLFSECKGKLGV